MFRGDIFEWEQPAIPLEPLTPKPLTIAQWRAQGGPEYNRILLWRINELLAYRDTTANPQLLQAAKAYYATHSAEFIMHWMDTFDPRKKTMRWMPFVFFERQAEFLQFLTELYTDDQHGLVEKARDMGLTWLCVCWSVWAWLFIPGISIGWGSRKQELVDKKGDFDSIFEKLRATIGRLPREFLPVGFDPAKHSTSMNIINPANGATITGEIGDNIGRGGRKTIYFKDESAHYEHPDLIEASLGDNTNIQVDISSVNGLGNVFQRRADQAEIWTPGSNIASGVVRKFIADWRDHPNKTAEWYEARKRKAENEGLLAKFLQEVERDYSGSLAGVIILREWVEAAIDAHVKLYGWLDDAGKLIDWVAGGWAAGLDVADSDDGDRNALVVRKGILLCDADEWGGARDVGATTRRAIAALIAIREDIECFYDSVGMGSNVKSEYNRLTLDMPELVAGLERVQMIAWNAGAGVQNPVFHIVEDDDETPLNKDFFGNLKAQAWWSLKMRFFRTWQAVTQKIRHDPDSMIAIDGSLPRIDQIRKELSQPVMTQNTALKQIVQKKPDNTKSPNLADAIVMAYYPIENGQAATSGTYGTS
jgi:phage terminase large subunit